ncbi:unnamed protein product [Blepharisma stoltei]|uniref:ER membrane protein complex subunit 4 n=1 Tax=Blepharisma stoltei TaxID=1481888 RepID=A0AAU9JHR6_9CILI|nr:unnamed protein product [Blepharisma stoltei]
MWQLNLDRSKEQIAEPYGYRTQIHEADDSSRRRQKDIKALKQQKAAEMANKPFMGMFSTFLMLYMSGSALNIIPIIITCMAMFTPIKTLFSFKEAFAPYEEEGVSLFFPKLKYLTLNMITMLAGIYKFSIMGLIPVNAEDWISMIPIRDPIEVSYGTLIS